MTKSAQHGALLRLYLEQYIIIKCQLHVALQKEGHMN